MKMEQTKNKKDRFKQNLTIEKEGDYYVSVHKKEYDYEDQGYFTNSEQRMKILNKDFCEKQVEYLKKDFMSKQEAVKKNEVLLKELKAFMVRHEKEYPTMIKVLGIDKKFNEYDMQQNDFKESVKQLRMFLEHYEEMLKGWQE